MAAAKSLGLGAFAVKTPTPQKDDNAELRNDATTPVSQDAKKAKASMVACTVRLPQADWHKIQQLALDERTSFQALAVAGLDAELKRRGLPGLGSK